MSRKSANHVPGFKAQVSVAASSRVLDPCFLNLWHFLRTENILHCGHRLNRPSTCGQVVAGHRESSRSAAPACAAGRGP